jgi:riboflavin kinase/FMN adenylyltransferase
MQVFGGYREASQKVPPLVYAIGNFDGVHLGHVSLIKRAQKIAKEHGVKCGLYTFWPHPRAVLSHAKVQLICTHQQKLRFLREQGLDYIVEEPFTHEFSLMSDQQFCDQVIAKELRAVAVVTGPNFRFGRGAMGTPAKMADCLKPLGIKHDLVPAVTVDGAVCSSSAIRQAVLSGEIDKAARLLGRPYSIVGTVVKGEGRGRTLGFATANLEPESTLIPANGVYATRVLVDGIEYAAATNIGTRPTFSDAHKIHIESHLLDFDQDIYGKRVEIFFLKKLRDERRFADVDELKKQLHLDLQSSR